MSSMRNPTGSYQHADRSRVAIQPMNYGNQTIQQDYSIPSSLYVEKRSHNPVSVWQPNQSQYIDPNRSSVGFHHARAIQADASGMYHQRNSNASAHRTNPVLPGNASSSSQSQYATFGNESLYAKKDLRAEIDDTPIIDPAAFHYLNLNETQGSKKSTRTNNESGIDTRPIINLDALTQFERRRQQQLEKNNRLRGDDGSSSGIDERPIVDINAFRHIESKSTNNNANERRSQSTTSGIDNRPITNSNACK
jgi:hypothetical protein